MSGLRAGNGNLYAAIEQRLPRNLDSICIETHDGLTYSWRDLHFASGRIANWLRSLSLKPGDRIAVQVEKSPECLMLYLAALRAGLVYVPLNTAYQRAELDYFLRDSEPAVVVCTPARLAEIQPIAHAARCRHVMTLGEQRDGTLLTVAAPFSDDCETTQRAADDLAALLYTSGTTGRSKGAMLSHRNLASNAATLDEFWGFKAERDAGRRDVLLHVLPLFHVHGLFVASHAALFAGATMLMLPKFDVSQRAGTAAALDGDDGRANVLHTAPRRTGIWPRALPTDAAVHRGLGTVAGRNASTVRAAHRTQGTRALRHVGDADAGFQSVR